MIVMMMGALSHPIVGLLVRFSSNFEKPSSNDYKFALTIIPIFIALSIILLYFTKETYKRGK